jgi:cytochrome P460
MSRRTSLPGATGTAKSAQLPNLAKSYLTFPEGYKDSFVKYHTINFPATRQVRHYYANKVAVQAAKEGKALPDGSYLIAEVYAAKLGADGKPVTGSDGFYIADKPLLYTAMARDAGWGKDIPEMLRNENWNYAVFTLDKKPRPINQAECLGCHKPLDKVSYTFTLKQISAVK